ALVCPHLVHRVDVARADRGNKVLARSGNALNIAGLLSLHRRHRGEQEPQDDKAVELSHGMLLLNRETCAPLARRHSAPYDYNHACVLEFPDLLTLPRRPILPLGPSETFALRRLASANRGKADMAGGDRADTSPASSPS